MRARGINQIRIAQAVLLVAVFASSTGAFAAPGSIRIDTSGKTTSAGSGAKTTAPTRKGSFSSPGKNSDESTRPRQDSQFNRTNNSGRPMADRREMNFDNGSSRMALDRQDAVDTSTHILLTEDNSQGDSDSGSGGNHNQISDNSGSDSKSDKHHSHDGKNKSTTRTAHKTNNKFQLTSFAGNDPAGEGDAANISGGNTSAQAGAAKDGGREALELQMHEGTAFVAHKKPVILHTPNGDIKISPGAVAYAVQKGNEVSIYNFTDSRKGDVMAILPNNKSVPVAYGHHLLLTKNTNAKFEEVAPAKTIIHSNVKNVGTENGVAMFDTQFSPVSLLDTAVEFKQLAHSSSPNNKKMAAQILKSAVILSNLEGQ